MSGYIIFAYLLSKKKDGIIHITQVLLKTAYPNSALIYSRQLSQGRRLFIFFDTRNYERY